MSENIGNVILKKLFQSITFTFFNPCVEKPSTLKPEPTGTETQVTSVFFFTP